MISTIIIDLDGCLVDARELHYESLNRALLSIAPRFIISREEHLSTYDGLNTSRKLEILTEKKGLPKSSYHDIWTMKQKETLRLIEKMGPDEDKIHLLKELKEKGYTIIVASNSIRQTLKMMLLKRGLMEYVDFYLSNEDVIKPKPFAEIYLRAMIKAGSSPKETLIIEDSPTGRKAANSTGATVMGVTSPDELTVDNVLSYLAESPSKVVWKDPSMNILIPMAGRGSRFEKAGYTFPKPLIEVDGEPMIKMVVDNLAIEGHYILIVQKEHYQKYNLQTLLTLIAPGCDIIQVEGITEGAACTTLLAKDLINNDKPLLIANSDQYLEWNSSDFMWSMAGDGVDGGIVTFTNFHPKWSFVKVNEHGLITEVAEKKPISSDANCGVYYWKKGKDYVLFASRMIRNNIRTNGEFYVAPAYNSAIEAGYKIKNYHIENFYGTGTPEDLEQYLADHKKI